MSIWTKINFFLLASNKRNHCFLIEKVDEGSEAHGSGKMGRSGTSICKRQGAKRDQIFFSSELEWIRGDQMERDKENCFTVKLQFQGNWEGLVKLPRAISLDL